MTEQTDIITQRTGRKVALFLDFDGVLVEIAPSPDAIVVPPDLPSLLTRLHTALEGALAVVSGRPLAEIDHFLKASATTVFGSHGAQFRLSGRTGTPDPEAAAAAQTLTARARAAFDGREGLLVEAKPAGVAVHYRGAPNARAAVEEEMRAAVAAVSGFELLAGKMVFEARMKGHDKGQAVRTVMAEAPFAGRVPIFIGDDVTDEDGMRAAIAFGGYGIKVGEGDSVAQFRLADPAAVHDLLADYAKQTSAKPDATRAYS